MVARRFYKLFRHVIFRIHASGRARLKGRGPVILVSNHAGSFGPISVMTTVGGRIRPWVTSVVTEPRSAAERVRVEFLEAEMGLRPPLSRWLARVLGRICAALMRDIGAIPVYDRSRRIRETLDQTLAHLERGHNVLVFPENAAAPKNDVLCDFCTGFVHLARAYCEKTRRAIAFLPVAVHRRAQALRIGRPIPFDSTAPFGQEKQRVKSTLESVIYRMYRELE